MRFVFLFYLFVVTSVLNLAGRKFAFCFGVSAGSSFHFLYLMICFYFQNTNTKNKTACDMQMFMQMLDMCIVRHDVP